MGEATGDMKKAKVTETMPITTVITTIYRTNTAHTHTQTHRQIDTHTEIKLLRINVESLTGKLNRIPRIITGTVCCSLSLRYSSNMWTVSATVKSKKNLFFFFFFFLKIIGPPIHPRFLLFFSQQFFF